MERLNNDMRACGVQGLPQSIAIDGETWHLRRTFKHDFFACTGLYGQDDIPKRLVLKLSRTQPFLGLPMTWLGRWLRRREQHIINRLNEIDQIPEIIERFGKTGLVYRYIEGKSLDEQPELPEDFFEQLEGLMTAVHDRNVCYVDMNKRGNILLGTDGRPYLIDFQISLYFKRHWSGFIKHAVQREDRYHLLKHKRRFFPNSLTDEEQKTVSQKSWIIRIHRAVGGSLRNIRRALLKWMYRKHIIEPDIDMLRTPENNHQRFL
ncbi:MAG: hypothetical protein ACYSUT_01200 [Planctomycetota bacterium]